ncbi:MAG TPA: ABC transporter permease [Vicinamibacteria bacterium]|nr:ABC transporter permease [Vicinamibacteria bacterium]
MSSLAQDLRFAARVLARSPGTTLAAVASLALAIGANTTIFTWASAVFLDPLPGVPNARELMVFNQTDPNEGFVSLSYPDYRDYRDRNRTLSGFAVTRAVLLSIGGERSAERVYGQLVSGNFFEALGVSPAPGRAFLPEEDAPGASAVVVLSDALWRRSFGGDPALVGQTIRLNARPFTVVGIAPAGFAGSQLGLRFEAWVPMAMQEAVEPGGSRLEARGNRWLDAFARLKPGVDRDTAEADLARLYKQLEAEHPENTIAGRGVSLSPLTRAPKSGAAVLGPIMLALSAIVGLVLLIACANVANVLLARAVSRRREMAVRLAIGARRGDLVRQLLVESVTLSVMGGAAGLVLAGTGDRILASLIPATNFPIGLNAALDWRALAFTLVACVAAGVLFGLAPALAAGRDLAPALRDEAASVAGGRGRQRLRHVLVISQVAISLVLLVVAGLFVRSLRGLQAYDVGFQPRGVLLASVELFSNGYDRARGLAFQRALLERAAALPGVESASLARRLPLGLGGTSSSSIEVEGYDAPAEQPAWGYNNVIGPGYFRALRTPLLFGREFEPRDDAEAPGVVIVNATLARRYFGEERPVGRRLRLGEDWLEVVGVVPDTAFKEIAEKPAPWFYLPHSQYYRPDVTLIVRSAGDPGALRAPVMAAIASLDPGLPVFGVRTLEEHVGASAFRQRLGSRVLGAFGALGLALAAIGLYGVLAYAVSQRQREIGVRLAVGARPGDVFALVMRQGLGLVAAGGVTGLMLALPTTRLLRSLLVGTSPSDPATYAGVALLLGAVAALACFFPARRATRVDPMTTLRCE